MPGDQSDAVDIPLADEHFKFDQLANPKQLNDLLTTATVYPSPPANQGQPNVIDTEEDSEDSEEEHSYLHGDAPVLSPAQQKKSITQQRKKQRKRSLLIHKPMKVAGDLRSGNRIHSILAQERLPSILDERTHSTIIQLCTKRKSVQNGTHIGSKQLRKNFKIWRRIKLVHL